MDELILIGIRGLISSDERKAQGTASLSHFNFSNSHHSISGAGDIMSEQSSV
jgi:hypothetical protein